MKLTILGRIIRENKPKSDSKRSLDQMLMKITFLLKLCQKFQKAYLGNEKFKCTCGLYL